MKKLFYLLSIVFVVGCNENKTLELEASTNEYLTDLQVKVKETTEFIYNNYWDGEKFDLKAVIDYCNKDAVSEKFTRTEQTVESVFSKSQRVIFDNLMSMVDDNNIDYDLLRVDILELPKEEQNVMLESVNAIQVILSGINETSIAMNTKGRFQNIMCGMVSGGVGAIYGAWAGALIGGPAGVAVSIVAGAVISEYMCNTEE